MRLFDIFSRHPRGEISAHADGELAAGRLGALEAHLTGCERCRTELGELLAVRSALRDLPQVAAPRSFTLTPAMAEREPAPVTSRATPSFVAMRVAGAGFAAVLAVVVMLDAGGIVDDTGGGSSDEPSTALFEADQTNRDTEAYGLLPGDDAGAPAAGGDGDLPAAGSVGGPDGSEDALASDDEGPPLNELTDDDGQQLPYATTTPGDGARPNNFAGDDSDAAAPESGDGAPAALTAEDDGVSSLLIIEIGLAAIAALAIGGSFVMRRRAESE